MSQGSFPVSCNQPPLEYTYALNSLIAGVDSSNSGDNAPTSNLQEGKIWLDTSNAASPILKIYDASANEFRTLFSYNSTTEVWEAFGGGDGGDYVVVNSSGTAASATGTDAIAIGESSSSVAPNSIAIGNSATTANTSSIDYFSVELETGVIYDEPDWKMSIQESLTSNTIYDMLGTSTLSSDIRQIAINNKSSISLFSETRISDALAASNRDFMETVRDGDIIKMTVQDLNNSEITATSTATFVISGTPLYQRENSSLPATSLSEYWRIPVAITSDNINEATGGFTGISDGTMVLSEVINGTGRIVQFHIQKAGGGIAIGNAAVISGDNSMAIAIGNAAAVSGENSMAIGNAAAVSGENCTALGHGAVSNATGVELFLDDLDSTTGIGGTRDWRMKTSDDTSVVADDTANITSTLSSDVQTIFICCRGSEGIGINVTETEVSALRNKRILETMQYGDTLTLTVSENCSNDITSTGTVAVTLRYAPTYEFDNTLQDTPSAENVNEFWRLRVSITSDDINNLPGVTGGSVALTPNFATLSRTVGFRFDYATPANHIDNRIVLGNTDVDFLHCNTNSISSLSDERDKADITDLSDDDGLPFINKLKPRTFYWDRREWYDNLTPDGTKKKTTYVASTPNSGKRMGFIAQETEVAMEGLQCISDSNLVTGNPYQKEMANAELITPLVKAMQQLSSENDALKARLDALENP